MTMNSRAQLLDAIALATLAHAGQSRKGSDDPYVIHPIRVARSLEEVTLPDGVSREDCMLAAILHDILEDTTVPRETLVQEFGDAVIAIVDDLTQDKALPQAERKQLMIDHCATMSKASQIVKLADRLDNMREMDRMPADFIHRYCNEAREMLKAMQGACPVLESGIAEIIATHDATGKPGEAK